MGTAEVIALVSAIIALGAVIVAVYFNSRKEKRDDVTVIKKDALEEAKIIVKLEEISNDVKDIKYDVREMRDRLNDLDKRITIAEKTIVTLRQRLEEHIDNTVE